MDCDSLSSLHSVGALFAAAKIKQLRYILHIYIYKCIYDIYIYVCVYVFIEYIEVMYSCCLTVDEMGGVVFRTIHMIHPAKTWLCN